MYIFAISFLSKESILVLELWKKNDANPMERYLQWLL